MDWFERLTGFRDVNAEHDGLPIGQDAPQRLRNDS